MAWRAILYATSTRLPQFNLRAYGTNSQATCNLNTGATYELSHSFTSQDALKFMDLTGDNNPIHENKRAAAARGFSNPILPGLLCASLFPALIARNFPGALYMTQCLRFRKEVLVSQFES